MKQLYKVLLGLLLLGSLARHSYAQTEPTFTQEVDHLFQHLNKSHINTGLLYDRVFPFARLDLFGQFAPDTANADLFIQAYSELRHSSYAVSSLLTTDNLRYKIRQSVDAGIIPIGLITYKFNQIDTLALEDGLLYLSDSLYYDASPRSRSPYWEKRTNMAAIFTETVNSGTVQFKILPDLVASNLGLSINSVQIDFGNGLNSYTIGQSINVNFSSGGLFTIKYIIHFSNGTQATTYSTLNVEHDAVASFSTSSLSTTNNSTSIRKPDIPPCTEPVEIYSEESFIGYDESTPIKGKGDVSYYYSDPECNNKVLLKPIIILDGFDPGNGRTGPSLYANELEYERTPGEFINLGTDLRKKGYDVIVLNFPENEYINQNFRQMWAGADYIERNAYVLVTLIKEVNAKLAENGSTAELIIMGPSMGGLISRYALAYMEQKLRDNPAEATWNHRTKLWFSFDSPHLGANIPIGDQYFIEYYAVRVNNTGADNGLKMLDTPAARQMLVHHHSAKSEFPQAHSFRQSLLNNFACPG